MAPAGHLSPPQAGMAFSSANRIQKRLRDGVFYNIHTSGEEIVDSKIRFFYYLKQSTALMGYHGIVRYDPFEYWKTE